jgi:hypothetical protein
MTFGNAYPNLPDPETSRERLELETRVLAAALRQSLERGDTEGSSQAHHQIFILLKASQDMGWEEPISLPPDLVLEKKRSLPDIDWGAPEDDSPIIALAEEELVDSAEIAAAAAADMVASEFVAEELVAPEPDSGSESDPEPVAVEAADEPAEEVTSEVGGEVVNKAAGDDSAKQDSNKQESADSQEEKAAPACSSSADEVGPCETIAAEKDVPVLADYYGQLNVDQAADFFTIHKSFLRQVRPLLLKQETEKPVGAPRKELLTRLQCMWVAHDILSDAATRTDYDFRRMGLRSGNGPAASERSAKATPLLRIGELLQCAGLLETTELEIAADMHKAMPELMFGAFLVKQGFIAEEDLNCVLLGQQLLKSASVTVAQFQKAMEERATAGGELGDILMANNYVTDSQLQEAYRNQSEDTLPRVPAIHGTVSLEASEAEVAQSLAEDDTSDDHSDVPVAAAAPPRVLSAGHAVPSWKDQLDWSSPEEPQTSFTPGDENLSGGQAIAAEQGQEFGETSGSYAAMPQTGAENTENTENTDSAAPHTIPDAEADQRGEARQPRKSLIDLMAGLKEGTLATELPEDIDNEPSEGSLMSSILQKNTAVPTTDDFAPPVDDTQEFDSMAEEFAALDAAAEEALDVEEHIQTSSPVVSPTSGSSSVAQTASPASIPSSSPSSSPSSNPAPRSSSMAKDLAMSIEQQKESGSWSIVSVPASALASLLLDEEPEQSVGAAETAPDSASTNTSANTAEIASTDSSHSTESAAATADSASVNAEGVNGNTNANVNTATGNTATGNTSPAGKNKSGPPYNGPERRGKRRRTRS